MARPMPRLPPVTIAVLPENIGKGFYRGVPLSEKLILAVRMTGRLGHSNMWVRTSNGVRASTAAAVSIGGPEMTFTLSTVPSAVTVASRMTTPSTRARLASGGYFGCSRIFRLLNVDDLTFNSQNRTGNPDAAIGLTRRSGMRKTHEYWRSLTALRYRSGMRSR